MTRFDGLSGCATRGLWSALFIVACGCGKDDLVRHEVEGTVTFAGKNVEAGQVMFEPDVELGMVAPSGFARIENGAYKITREAGPIAGRYRFRVVGFDMARVKTTAEGSDVPMLFPEYVTNVTIPPPDDRFDIEVPAASGGRR
jgi:hypothetical protein